MKSNVIDIKILAQDMASSVVKGIKSDTDNLTSSIKSSAPSWKTLAGSILGATLVMKGVQTVINGIKSGFSALKDMINEGADFVLLEKTSKRAAENLGVTNKEFDKMVENLAESNTFGSSAVKTVDTFIQAGLVEMTKELKRVNTATGDLDTGFNAFVLTAKDFGAKTGVGSARALDLMTRAIQRQDAAALDALGIQVNMNQVMRDYSSELGKSVTELSNTERQQAILNELMKQGEKVVGSYDAAYETAAKNIMSFKDATKAIREELGSKFEPLLKVVTGGVLGLAKGFRTFIVENREKITAFFENAAAKLQAFVDGFGAGFGEMKDNVGGALDGLKEALSGLKEALGITDDGANNFGHTLGLLAGQFIVMVINGLTMLVNIITSIRNGISFLKLRFDEFMASPIGQFIQTSLVSAFNMLKQGLIDLQPVMPLIKMGLKAIAVVIGALLLATIGSFIAVLLVLVTTVGLVVAAFGKLVQRWKQMFNQAKAVFNGVRETIVSSFTTAKNTAINLMGAMQAKFNEFKARAVNIFVSLKTILIGAFEVLKARVTGTAETLKSNVVGKFNSLKDLASVAMDTMKAKIVDSLVSLRSAASSALSPIAAAFDSIKNAVERAISAVGRLIGKISSVSTGNISSVVANIPAFASGVKNFAGGIAVVGEEGPELVNLPKGSDVLSAGKTKGAIGSIGGGIADIIRNLFPSNGRSKGDQLAFNTSFLENLIDTMGLKNMHVFEDGSTRLVDSVKDATKFTVGELASLMSHDKENFMKNLKQGLVDAGIQMFEDGSGRIVEKIEQVIKGPSVKFGQLEQATGNIDPRPRRSVNPGLATGFENPEDHARANPISITINNQGAEFDPSALSNQLAFLINNR